MTEDPKENPPVQDESVRESSTSKETEGVTRRKILKGAAGVRAAVAVAYAPPSLRRIAMPSALAKTSPGKEDGEKDPSSDKSGDKTGDKTTDKDPASDKDPEEKTKEGKETKETKEDKETKESSDKDPVTDEDPDEKTKEADTSAFQLQDLSRFARKLFDEWS